MQMLTGLWLNLSSHYPKISKAPSLGFVKDLTSEIRLKDWVIVILVLEEGLTSCIRCRFVSGKSMVWFGSPGYLAAIYGPLAFAGMLSPYLGKKKSNTVQANFEAQLGFSLYQALAAAGLTAMGLKSGYLSACWSLAGLFGSLVISKVNLNMSSLTFQDKLQHRMSFWTSEDALNQWRHDPICVKPYMLKKMFTLWLGSLKFEQRMLCRFCRLHSRNVFLKQS